MKKGWVFFLLAVLFFCWRPSSGQEAEESLHYYNVDTEKKVKGTVQEIFMEPRYKDGSPFLVIVLEEKKTQQIFQVEVSPVRFFTHDFYKGEEIEVLGSLFPSEAGIQNIIARQLRHQGEVFILRDKHGFPAWRGDSMKARQRRKGKEF